ERLAGRAPAPAAQQGREPAPKGGPKPESRIAPPTRDAAGGDRLARRRARDVEPEPRRELPVVGAASDRAEPEFVVEAARREEPLAWDGQLESAVGVHEGQHRRPRDQLAPVPRVARPEREHVESVAGLALVLAH